MIQWEMIRDDFASVQDETSYFIIMQFTGVLDKNGKEIYQGDVVRSFNDGNDAWRGAETFEIISMEYSAYGLWAKTFKNGPDIGNMKRLTDGHTKEFRFVTMSPGVWIGKPNLEVVGNIYENPELFD